MKFRQFAFLTGLPRSGSLLLATLLNQNEKICASGESALLESTSMLRNSLMNSAQAKFGLKPHWLQQTLWTYPHYFYQHVEDNIDIIVDRNPTWSTPENYELANKFAIAPRFIVLYRPILDVLTSFVDVAQKNKDFYLNKALDSSDFYPKHYLERNDALAEYLMTRIDLLPENILGLEYAKKKQNDGLFCFITYDDLVSDTQNQMDKVFDFLKTESIKLELDNLGDLFRYKDSIYLGVSGFNRVRPTISKHVRHPEDYFSDYILEKYSNALTRIGL